jgi:SNF2 family DNA or RNA helicase
MGLGKTTATIIAALETGAKKILIICPASLKINWQREIANYSDRSVFICESKNFSTEHDFVITNYDIIKNFYDIKDKENSPIYQCNFDLIVIDEAHNLRTIGGTRFDSIFKYTKKADKVLLLTATPLINYSSDIINLIALATGDKPISEDHFDQIVKDKNLKVEKVLY